MAKTAEGDPDRVLELKRELRVIVMAILDDTQHQHQHQHQHSDSHSSNSSYLDAIDRATHLLSALKLKHLNNEVTLTPSLTLDHHHHHHHHHGIGSLTSSPPHFRCPLSNKLMIDPVIISTGQTYERAFIQKWLKAGHRICPITQQVLSHTLLTPNYLVKDMISQWCQAQGIEIPDPVGYVAEEGATGADREHFCMLLSKMSKSIQEQKAAAKELRLLTKRMPSFRALFGESTEAIQRLLSPLVENRNGEEIPRDVQLQEDLITTLLNISIQDSNKKLVAETPQVIPLLIDVVQSGTLEARSNAAAALFTLSALDSNKILIGKSGALKPLIDLLDEGHPMAMKDAASAIFNLCIVQENKSKAVKQGAVKAMLGKIKSGVQVDELLAILAMLSTHQEAVEEMAEMGGVPCLLSIIRGNSCARNQENCIAILYTVCTHNRAKLRDIREEERCYGTLSHLAQHGTSRAKRKAVGLLDRINRAHNRTYTA